MTRWRQRMGEERLNALLSESLATAVRKGAAKPADCIRAIVDTAVQPKAVTHPTDAKLMQRTRERLVRLARKLGIELRRSYARVGEIAINKQQCRALAKQFNRAGKAFRKLRIYIDRVIRDIVRKTMDEPELKAVFAQELMLARRVHAGNGNLNWVKKPPKDADLRVFSLHAPEVECIGKGKDHKPYEFGVKDSVATTRNRSEGRQFIPHVQALSGKSDDGHTLVSVIPAIEAQVGASLSRIIRDAGYKGHNAPQTHRFKVYAADQKGGMTQHIGCEMRRRSAVEPVIGHLKDDHSMGRNHLAHTQGNAANAVFAHCRLQLQAHPRMAQTFAGHDLGRSPDTKPRESTTANLLRAVLHGRLLAGIKEGADEQGK